MYFTHYKTKYILYDDMGRVVISTSDKRIKGMKSLIKAQRRALKRSHDNLRKIINDIEEMNDLYLSDVAELSKCFYDIGNEFLLDNSSYWNYKDPDDAEE